MSNVLPFRKPAAPPRGLCQHGLHQWKVVTASRFDVHEGRLVTVWQCERCGARRNKAT